MSPIMSLIKHDIKQKIVIKVQLKNKKCRCKAMMISAMASGVISVSLELKGEKNDYEVVIIGNGVDSASLTGLLRKKVGHATLELVEELG